MDILRFTTAGNVDDGKSTLIGRLLYDTNNIKADVLQSVTSSGANDAYVVNLAHITDGLRSEREQGITIDVAYKYFTTPKRKYIITDAPGHAQYTKNLVTGASFVDVMIILIDVQNGITEQTRRHSLVASFFRIKQVVVAVNKMDAVGYDQNQFTDIVNDYRRITEKLRLNNVTFIPVSALFGDNVSFVSDNMHWYKGRTLMQYLESCEPVRPRMDIARFSVQHVIDSTRPYYERGYIGKVLSGVFKVGNAVSVHPNSQKDAAIISKIVNGYMEVSEVKAGENVCLYFINLMETQRGGIISHLLSEPLYDDSFEATICWLDSGHPLLTGKEYFLRIGPAEVHCRITEIVHKIDIDTLEKYNAEKIIEVNEFAHIRIQTSRKISYDSYEQIPELGRGILIDPMTNNTSGAFIIN